jgi:hypothetical protein
MTLACGAAGERGQLGKSGRLVLKTRASGGFFVNRADAGSRLGCALRGGRNGGNAVSFQARPIASSWAGPGSGWHGRSPPGAGSLDRKLRRYATPADPQAGTRTVVAMSALPIPLVHYLFLITFPTATRRQVPTHRLVISIAFSPVGRLEQLMRARHPVVHSDAAPDAVSQPSGAAGRARWPSAADG